MLQKTLSQEQLRISVAPQHLLRCALIDCFDLSETERERVSAAADAASLGMLDLHASDWQRLKSVTLTKEDNILSLLCLSPAMLHDYLPSPKTFNRTVHSLIRFVRKCAARHVLMTTPHLVSVQCPVPFRDIDPRSELILSEHDLPKRLVTRAMIVGLSTWGEASQTRETAVTTQYGLSWRSIETLQILHALGVLGQGIAAQIRQMHLRNAGTLDSILGPELRPDVTDSKKVDILIARLGLRTGEPATLQRVASDYGLTRERIRQIEASFVKKANQQRSSLRTYRPFWLVVESILAANRGALSTEAFNTLLVHILHLAHGLAPKGVQKLLSFAPPELQIDVRVRGAEVYVTTNRLPCPNCRAIVRTMTEFLTNSGITSVEAACGHLGQFCKENCTVDTSHMRDNLTDFLHYLAFTTESDEKHLKIASGVVYLADATGRTPVASVTLEVLRVLASEPGPWRVQDICAHFIDRGINSEAVSPHQVAELLAHRPEVVHWDWSTFVHRKFVRVSPALLDRIQNWILDKLCDGAPTLSIRAARKQFQGECDDAGLTSDFALYSLLRSHSSSLGFPRYSQVTRPEQGTCTPFAAVIEQYISAAPGPLPIKAVKEHFTKEVGLKPTQLFQAISENPRLLRHDKERYVHSKVFFDMHPGCEETVRAIAGNALEFLERGETVTPMWLLERHKVDCRVLGITTPQMLTSLLTLLAGDRVRVHGGNRILAATNPTTELRSLQRLICDFVQNRAQPVTVDEIDRHFVSRLGYSRYSLVSPLRSAKELMRYGPNTFVHVETLGWSSAKSSDLEALALEEYEKAVDLGRVFAVVTSLIESERLPSLANSLVYTRTCLSQLLARCDAILVLGWRKNAFVPRQNADDIRDIDKLVQVVVKRQFGGGCTLHQLEMYLLQHGVIGDHLPKDLFNTLTEAKGAGSQSVGSLASHSHRTDAG